MRGLWILLRWPLRAWLHRRCLRRIAALEIAVGLAPDPFDAELSRTLQSTFPTVHTYAQMGLLGSAAWAAEKVEWLA